MRLRPDLSATITGDVLNEMTYSRQVVKEVLRYRPPAPMVPQVREVTLCWPTDLTTKARSCIACPLMLYHAPLCRC